MLRKFESKLPPVFHWRDSFEFIMNAVFKARPHPVSEESLDALSLAPMVPLASARLSLLY